MDQHLLCSSKHTGDCTILATKSKIGNLLYLPYKGVTAT